MLFFVFHKVAWFDEYIYPYLMAWTCGRSRKLKSKINQDYEKHICDSMDIREIINSVDDDKKLYLDIGFGSGASIFQTMQDSNAIVIGCEIFKPAILQTLAKIEDKGCVFLFMSFIDDLLNFIPSCSFHEIKMLFPDPWPKYKHRMRRCYNIPNFDLKIARILKGGGRFITVSDIADISYNMTKLFDNPIFKVKCKQYESYDVCPYKTYYCKKGFEAGRIAHEMVAKKII